MSPSAELVIATVDRSGTEIDLKAASDIAVRALSRLGFETGELGLTFLGTDEMADLNRKHMGKEGPTDVLSFPIDTGDVAEEEMAAGVPVLLGDVVICPVVAAEQAADLGTTFEQELCLLVVHGVLHIAGHDHESDSGEMDSLQAELAGEICG